MNDPNVMNEALSVKAQKQNTIVRVVHNRENPFVQLNKHALWDPNLSLKAVGLWARCMSRPNDWKFCISELVKHCKEGRKAVDSAMQELLKAGYACRFEADNKGPDGKFTNKVVEYVFFEFPATQEDKDQQLEIFKKFYRDCGFGNLRGGNLRNGELLIQTQTEIQGSNKKENPSLTVPEEPGVCVSSSSSEIQEKAKTEGVSQEARALLPEFIKVIQEVRPKFRVPKNVKPMLEALDGMLHEDKRTPEEILRVLRWAVNDNLIRGDWTGWASKILGKNPAAYLRNKFDAIETQSKAKKDRKFCPSSDDDEALRIIKDMRSRAI